jgi:hypothetical protein
VAEAEVALYLRVSVLCITESSSYDAGQSGPIWRYARRSRAGAAQFIDSQRITQGANKEVRVVTLRGLTPFPRANAQLLEVLCVLILSSSAVIGPYVGHSDNYRFVVEIHRVVTGDRQVFKPSDLQNLWVANIGLV